MKLKISFFLFCIIVTSNAAYAKAYKRFTELHFVPYAGVSWQSTLFKPVFNFAFSPDLSSSFFPYQYERNTQGFGLDLGYSLTTNIAQRQYIGFKMNGRFRYDYLYGGMETVYTNITKTFLFDYSTFLCYVLKITRIGTGLLL